MMHWKLLIQRIWEFLYPPYELSRYGASAASDSKERGIAAFHGKKANSQDVQQHHLVIAEAIYKNEIDRKKNIEDKAGNFLAGVAISSSIVMALPALLSEKIDSPLYAKVGLLTVFMVAVAYLLIAAIYAVKVRARAPHYVLNSSSLESFDLTAPDFRRRWAEHLIDLAHRNEPLLILKANQLYLAEKTFLRGVTVAIFGGLLLGIAVIFYPKVSVKTEAVIEREGGDVLTSGLSHCLQSNSNLSAQLLAVGEVLGELKAQLAGSIKAQAELKKKVHPRQRIAQQNFCMPVCQASTNSEKCMPEKEATATKE